AVKERSRAAGHVSAEHVLLYLQKRPTRQLTWFRDSRARLTDQAGARRHRLLTFYVCSLLLPPAKTSLFLVGASGLMSSGEEHLAGGEAIANVYEGLTFGLLTFSGISGVMTAYYFNQNSRSLIHRYAAQEWRIAQWLDSFGVAGVLNAARKKADIPSETELRSAVVAFEDMMIEELVDWIHISQHD